jgi:hypothetical protein
LQNQDTASFGSLKKEIAAKMKQSFPGISLQISEWKGQDIVNFQEELLVKVNAHISEKWFYTHMKSEKVTLPRVDILNLLSKYVGYSTWDEFKFKNSVPEIESVSSKTDISTKKANRYFLYIPILVIVILGVFFILFKLLSTRDYVFRFYDADSKEPITNNIIEVSLLVENESPVNFLCRPDGSFQLKTDQRTVHLIVKSPYYQTDTIIRSLDKFNPKEIIKLRPNNYALMIHYFSQMNVKDWQKRRTQLDRMISDSAMIYQVFNKGSAGLELFNKWEFIDKLTLPSRGLKGIEILDTKSRGERIYLIRFRQKEVK